MALWPSRLHPAHLLPLVIHDLQLAGIAAAILTGIAAVVFGARRAAADASSIDGSSKRVFGLSLPESFERAGLDGFFRTVSLLLRPVLLGGQPSVEFTLSAISERLAIELSCAAEIAPAVVAALEAAIDGIAIDEVAATGASGDRRRWLCCTLRPSGSRWLPLQEKHKVDPARFVLAMLRGESESERAVVQVVFSPLGRRGRGRAAAARLRTGRRGGPVAGLGLFGLEVVRDGVEIFLPGGSQPSTQTARPTYTADHWTLKQAGAIEEKTAEPLLAATVRLAVSGGRRRSMGWRLRALAASFAQFQALGGLRTGRELFGARRFERRLPALRPALALSAAEAAALLPLPSSLSETRLVLAEAPARRLAPAADAPRAGIRLGRVER